MRYSAVLVFSLQSSVFGLLSVHAQEPASKASVSAPRMVREGNRFLQGGDPGAALERYREAKTAEPDAREIAFDEGLAHYALGEFDRAREDFDRAAAGQADSLADDANYSAGAVDHAEALAQPPDPKQTLSKLESAMQRYHGVLSRQPDHPAARDANRKAAAYWRELKQQLEQQQQQQQQEDSPQDQDQQDQDEQKQKPSPSESKDQQPKEDSESAEQKDPQNAEQQQQQEAQAKEDQSEKEQQAQAAKEEQEDASREQAERKLREMLQAMKDRKKQRKDDVRKVPVSPVDKDW